MTPTHNTGEDYLPVLRGMKEAVDEALKVCEPLATGVIGHDYPELVEQVCTAAAGHVRAFVEESARRLPQTVTYEEILNGRERTQVRLVRRSGGQEHGESADHPSDAPWRTQWPPEGEP